MLQCSDSTLTYILILLCHLSGYTSLFWFSYEFGFTFCKWFLFLLRTHTMCVKVCLHTHTHTHIYMCVRENIGEALLHIFLSNGEREGMAKWWFLSTASTCKVNKRSKINCQLIWDPNVLMKAAAAASISLHIIFVKSLQFSTRYYILLSPKVSAKFYTTPHKFSFPQRK